MKLSSSTLIVVIMSSAFDAMASGSNSIAMSFVDHAKTAVATTVIILVFVLIFLFLRMLLSGFSSIYKNREAIKLKYEETLKRTPLDIDDDSWSQAYEELSSEIQDKALWAKIQYKFKGDEDRTKTEYVMNRAKNLSKNKQRIPASDFGLDKDKTECDQPYGNSANPEMVVSDQVRVIINELKILGCEVQLSFAEKGSIEYQVKTRDGVKYSGVVNDFDFEQILKDVV
jgi:hypothetical protein